MKFELKTENENYSKSLSNFFRIFIIFSLIIISCDMTLKLGIISKNYEFNYNCRLLAVEKSAVIFKKLSRISNLKSKQRIWEFCREFVR